MVSKQELIDAVWPDAHVDENNIAQNISVLRKALAAFSPDEYVQTLPRRGYRFVGAVTEDSAARNGGATQILADPTLPAGTYRREGNVLSVDPAVVESFAAFFIEHHLKGTPLRGPR